MTPVVIAAWSLLIVAAIGALVTGAVTIIRVLAETRALAEAVRVNAQIGATAGQKRDGKLDRIEVLVDGRYGEVLQELADVKNLIAQMTGKPSDHAKAAAAQLKADEQVARVVAAGPETAR